MGAEPGTGTGRPDTGTDTGTGTGTGTGRPDTRARIRDAAGTLFRRHGYSATGLKRVAAEAQAPFGSIYHFFPGGKQQLAEDMIRTSGPAYGRMVLALLDSVPDPAESLVHAFDAAATDLAAADYADACPIGTVALEVASSNEVLRTATAEVFEEWVEAAAGWFTRWVPDPEAARSLAYSLVMMLEGAFMLSRATRDPEPLRVAGRTMAHLLRTTLTEPGTPTPASD
ncbi:TetR/AcrR family transcriptional regulator [Streptomyces sp. NPDC047829]|uniref:TetR/AcrR family transcriptional regulator n=1 Tax=Streptomyces sp. NPDC047829 TaxID=3154609 RepID=UPI0033C8AC74